MPILRIEHPVPDYASWKRAFDGDPADRKDHAVRGYAVLRSVQDPSYVMIDLEFDTQRQAEGLLDTMRGVRAGPGREVMLNPQARIVDSAEGIEL